MRKISLLLILLLAGCNSVEKSDQPEIFQDVTMVNANFDKGYDSGAISKPSVKLIASLESWRNLWEAIEKNVIDPRPSPQVDFEKFSLVAAFQGVQMSRGYGIEISDIKWNGSILEVTTYSRVPHETEIVTHSVTSPYHIVKIFKRDTRVQALRQHDILNIRVRLD